MACWFEFENVDGEEYHGNLSTVASPASAGGPEVYILPLTEVSLPVAKQPARSVQLLKSTDLGRHKLLYLKEIGHGWFGKVLLGEVTSGLNITQVVIQELKANASVQQQMHFLEEARPYRTLQHPALLQCLAQCTQARPYLLVMEFCPLGDVKGYLLSCRASESITPEPLILQRMACDIASGLMHLHKHNFVHSDLALRNCLLTADVSVKIGDYGLSHTKYKDDYYVTSDQAYVPIRWIAPELVDEVHGNLLVAEQTHQSNIWSLGVCMWELLELASQPYRHYSDRQVLTYAVREQHLRLPKPMMDTPLADGWYEVMQFCWLLPAQRPTVEEVHQLLSYLVARGASEAEDDFERRWRSMRPDARLHPRPASSSSSSSSSSPSFPLLRQFSASGGGGDDVLTVTETSRGLNFEYRWEQARAGSGLPYLASSSPPACSDALYPPGGMAGGCPAEGVSPPYCYYEPGRALQLHPPGVVPVLDAHSPSVHSEYYIRIEEPLDSPPGYHGSTGSFLTGSAGGSSSGECSSCPPQPPGTQGSYWSAADAYDSRDSSPAISLTMEPLLGQDDASPPGRPWESGHYVSYKDQDGGYYYDRRSPEVTRYLVGRRPHREESWGSRSLRQALGELEDPPGIAASVLGGRGDELAPCLDTVTGGHYCDMMGSLRRTMPGHGARPAVVVDVEGGGALYIGHGGRRHRRRGSDSGAEPEKEEEEVEEDIFVERHSCNTWPAKHRHGDRHRRASSHGCMSDDYVDAGSCYTMPCMDVEDAWPMDFHSLPSPLGYLDPVPSGPCLSLGKHHHPVPLPPDHLNSGYVYLCQEESRGAPGECCRARSQFVEPLTGAPVGHRGGCHGDHCIREKAPEPPAGSEGPGDLSPAPGGPAVAKPAPALVTKTSPSAVPDPYVHAPPADGKAQESERSAKGGSNVHGLLKEPGTTAGKEKVTFQTTAPSSSPPPEPELALERSQAADSGVDAGGCCSSVTFTDTLNDEDSSEEDDDDVTDDGTSGISADGELDSSPSLREVGPPPAGTPDFVELASAGGSCGDPGPASPRPSSGSPKAGDSGYDTENNESPEFMPKEAHEPRDQPAGRPAPPSGEDEEEKEWRTEAEEVDGEAASASDLRELSDRHPYRDSAYFSDYENERPSKDEERPLANGDVGCGRGEAKEEEEEEQEDEGKDAEAELETRRTPSSPPGEAEEPGEDAETSLDEWPAREEGSSLGDWAAEVVGAMEEVLGALNGDGFSGVEEDEKEEEEKEGCEEVTHCVQVSETVEARRVKTPPPRLLPGEATHAMPKDEVALQHTANARRFSASSPPPPSPGATGREGERDEEADSDDSSDEELRGEEGSEEEEERPPVPEVVSDDSDARGLRSLLRGHWGALQRQRKVVSFFDDVTVYLFDQESPTKDLVEHRFLSGGENSGSQNKLHTSDDSDGNVSEESTGYEWEDDFPLLPLATSKMASDSPTPKAPKAPEPKPAPLFSRFTVSPSPVSRFSITHVSDSDVDPTRGSTVDDVRE